MKGVVTTSTLIIHSYTIITNYGIKLYTKCWYKIISNKISAHKQTITFLSLVME